MKDCSHDFTYADGSILSRIENIERSKRKTRNFLKQALQTNKKTFSTLNIIVWKWSDFADKCAKSFKKMQSKCCRTPMQINVDRISTVDCVYYSHLHKVQITLEMCDIKKFNNKNIRTLLLYMHSRWGVKCKFNKPVQTIHTLGYFLCSKNKID